MQTVLSADGMAYLRFVAEEATGLPRSQMRWDGDFMFGHEDATKVLFDTRLLTAARTQQVSDVSGVHLVLSNAPAPATQNAPCKQGELRINATHLFLCSADNTWLRYAGGQW